MKKLIALLGILLCAYAATAIYAAREVIEGIRAHDANRMIPFIDFPSVRASLKEQLAPGYIRWKVPETTLKSGTAWQSDGVLAKVAAASAAVGTLVDNFVTPAGVALLLTAGEPGEAGNTSNSGRFPVPGEVSILSPTEFGLRDKFGATLRFTFKGWSWKITSITSTFDDFMGRLPDDPEGILAKAKRKQK